MKRFFFLLVLLLMKGALSVFAQSGTVITTTEAAAIAAQLGQNEVTSKYYYIDGRVTRIQEVSTTYGNATFYFTDGTTELYCYRMFYLYDEKFTSSSQLQVGDTIRLYTRLKKYGTQNLLETVDGFMTNSSNLPDGLLFFTDGNLQYRRIHANDGLLVFCPEAAKQSLTELVIPATVQYEGETYTVSKIGPEGFSYCSALSSITLPNTITSIGKWAFYACSGLRSFTIPSNVTFIGKSAFYLCSGLMSITVPESVTSIDQGATFQRCTSLKTVYWNARNCSITKGSEGSYYPPFKSLNNITSFIFGDQVQSIPTDLCYGCSGLTSITLPNSLTTFGSSVFRYCSGLTAVTIPAGVTNVGDGPFSSCTSLTEIIVDEANRNYCSVDGVLFSKDKTMLVQHPSGKSGDYTIPNGVTMINAYAFDDCQFIPKLVIPNSLTSIGYGAIKNCVQLDTVISYAVTPPVIEANSFSQISSSAVLHVPYYSLGAYRANVNYVNAFAQIIGFSDVINITESSALLRWYSDKPVVQYRVGIYLNGESFASYVVDGADGHVISSQRYSPSIHKIVMDTTTSSTDYYELSIEGLNANTDYTYDISGVNAEQQQIYHEEGSFRTEGDEGILPIAADDPHRNVRKFVLDGQIFILRGDETYTITGLEVR